MLATLAGAATLIACGSAMAQNPCGPAGACPPPADNGCGNAVPCPAGCTGNGLNTNVGPSGAIKSHTPFITAGDPRGLIEYFISNDVSQGSVNFPNCNVTSVLLRFWSPANKPNVADLTTPCPATNAASFSTCIPLLLAGGASVDFDGTTTPQLAYTVAHADETANPDFIATDPMSFPREVVASVCACGKVQTGPGLTNATNNRNVRNPVIHPAITIVKSASITELCEGVSTPVTYTYLVTATGDVDLINISVTDDHCGPVNPVLNGAFNIGDVNTNNRLERTGPGAETWQFSCTTNISTTTTNTATANGDDFVLNIPVTGTDDLTIPANPRPVCQINPTASCDPAQSLTAMGNTCGPYTCTWTKDGQPFNVGNPSCTITATGPGVYCAVVTDCNGCVSESPSPCCATISSGPVCNNADISGPTPPITDCDTIEHCLTAVVGNTTPATTYLWAVTSGPCTIQGSATNLTVCFLLNGGPSCTLQITATTPGCAQTAVCTKTVECQTPGGEGRTPGFWKQDHHFGYWGPYCPKNNCPTGCTATTFCSAAGISCVRSDYNGCPGAKEAYFHANGTPKTMLEVIKQGGGGFKALGRHATAALLNSAVDPAILAYDFSTAEVQALIQTAVDTCDPSEAHSLLGDANEQEGGSLGGQCFCTNPCNIAPGQGAAPTADMNGDGKVTVADLQYLMTKWGTNDFRADLDRNGRVASNDLSILMNAWSQ